MLVYSKKSFRVPPRQLARIIRAHVESQPLPGLQHAREWLVATGQLEQAILDASGDDGHASAATFAAADMFLAAREPQCPPRMRWYAHRLALALRAVEKTCTASEVDVRVPEGFAWYALYPDSYAQTAERWAQRFGPLRPRVSVIGIRSIGTTLAAVVAQTLRRSGVAVTRCITLRTAGAPFSRSAELPADFAPATYNIVVDEGPGLSGSSMASVARALESAGAGRQTIHFFAGHDSFPGPAADESVRRWWSAHRIWTTHPDSTIIHGRYLPDALSAEVQSWTGDPATGPAEPLGPDGWRAMAGLEFLPRAIAPALETPKKLVRLSSGRAIVLKFAGFDLCSTSPREDETSRDCPASIPPSRASHGWAAMPWVEGARLSARDGTPQFISTHLGPWIARSALGEMTAMEVRDALARILSALESWAESRGRTHSIAPLMFIADRESARSRTGPQRCYGDGRLAPHEWIRTPDGAIRKTDHWPHHRDHTWVGRQPIGWDLAGAEIEWELDGRRAQSLRHCVRHLTGYTCSATALALFKAGYCAFRAAAAHHSATMTSDPRLSGHLSRACEWYECRLRSALAELAAELALA